MIHILLILLLCGCKKIYINRYYIVPQEENKTQEDNTVKEKREEDEQNNKEESNKLEDNINEEKENKIETVIDNNISNDQKSSKKDLRYLSKDKSVYSSKDDTLSKDCDPSKDWRYPSTSRGTFSEYNKQSGSEMYVSKDISVYPSKDGTIEYSGKDLDDDRYYMVLVKSIDNNEEWYSKYARLSKQNTSLVYGSKVNSTIPLGTSNGKIIIQIFKVKNNSKEFFRPSSLIA